MSRNSLNVISPRSEPKEPKQPKRDIWDDILRGLQISNGITGLAVDVSKIQEYKATQGERERLLAGKATPEERAKLGGTWSETESPGSISFQDTSTGKSVYRSQPEAAKPAISPAQQAALDLQREKFDFEKSQAAEKAKATEKAAAAKSVAAAKPDVKPPTEAQVASASFGRKAQAADALIADLESNGYDPASYKRAARDLPLIGSVTRTSEDRKYMQAQKEFIAAILRKESGGAITKDEFAQYGEIYFPSAGDDAEVIAQKADARQRATAGLLEAAGEGAVAQISDKTRPPSAPKPAPGTATAAPNAPATPPLQDIEAELKRRKLKPQNTDDLAPIPYDTGI